MDKKPFRTLRKMPPLIKSTREFTLRGKFNVPLLTEQIFDALGNDVLVPGPNGNMLTDVVISHEKDGDDTIVTIVLPKDIPYNRVEKVLSEHDPLQKTKMELAEETIQYERTALITSIQTKLTKLGLTTKEIAFLCRE